MLRKPAHRIARKSFLYNTQGNTNRGRWENTWRKELGKDEYYMKICRKPQDRRIGGFLCMLFWSKQCGIIRCLKYVGPRDEYFMPLAAAVPLIL